MDNPDIQRKIALDLDPSDFISLCSSKKEFYKNICENDIFWRLKIERDYPEIFNYFQKNGLILKNPKNTYIRTFKKIAELLEIYSSNIIVYENNKDVFKPIQTNKEVINKIYNVLSSSYIDYRKVYDNDYRTIRNILIKNIKKYNLIELDISFLQQNLISIILKSPLEKYK